MYRIVAVGFSLFVITLSILGMVYPNSMLSIFMDTSQATSVIRITLALLLLVYSAVPHVRYELPRKALQLAGLSIIWFLFSGLAIDNTPFPEPIDLFISVEGSVMALVASMDFYQPKQVRKLLPHITLPELLIARLRTVNVPAVPHVTRSKTA